MPKSIAEEAGQDYPGKYKPSSFRHTREGEEILDPTPMQPPLGYKKAPSLHDQIAQQVRQMKHELLLADQSIEETDEEADDFEVGDDFQPYSQHENDHMPSVKNLKLQAKRINDQIKEANRLEAIRQHENAIKKPMSITTPAAQPPSPTTLENET